MASDCALQTIAIVGGSLIDATGRPPLRDSVLVIEGERIVAVGGPSTEMPPHALQIPAHGRFVLPGLMDANVHLFFAATPDALLRFDQRYDDIILESAQVALKNGLTTVFDTWGPRQALFRVRDRIQRGDAVGSRIYAVGNIIGLGGPMSDDFFAVARTILSKRDADAIDERWEQGVGADLLWLTADEVRARVRAYIRSGTPNFLKYAASGHQNMQFIAFSAAVQRVIVEEGQRAGVTVQAHTTSPESLRMAIEAGADLLQHGDVTGKSPMPEESLQTIVRRGLPCAAMFTTRRFLAWNEGHGGEPLATMHRIKDLNDRRLIDAGAALLLTTDAGVWPERANEHPLIGPSASAEDATGG